MKPVNLAAQMAAVETELTCLKMVLAQARVAPALTRIANICDQRKTGSSVWISPTADRGAETGNQSPLAPGGPSDDS
jgi:hypothetical protein